MLPMGIERSPNVPQTYAEIRTIALAAEAAGLDSVWVADHLLAPDHRDAAASPWEAWTILTAQAEATERITFGTLVLCTAFRPPGVVARMADTLQDVSGNRLVLGLGAGWHAAEFHAFGLPYDHLAGRFAEALETIGTMLGSGRATVPGRFTAVENAPVRHRAERVAPEILVAAQGTRMLRLTARFADAWNTAWYGPPDGRFRAADAALSEACADIGRDPATLRRTVGVAVGGSHPFAGGPVAHHVAALADA